MSSFVKQVVAEVSHIFEQNPRAIEQGRGVYKSALEKRFNDLQKVTNTVEEKREYESDICHLFIHRATMEINLRQKKQAKNVFDEAFKHSFCNCSSLVWKAYISFYIRENKIEEAKKLLSHAVQNVDPEKQFEIWEFWVEFERSLGNKEITISQLKAEVNKGKMEEEEASSISKIYNIFEKNGTVDTRLLNENYGREIKRDHRAMSLFQKPTPRIETIYNNEEAPHIPNRILYYFAVVMSDPQMCLIIKELQKYHDLFMDELDLSQQYAYHKIFEQMKNLDLSIEEVKRKTEEKMNTQYNNEKDELVKITKEFQEYLQKAGVPGFMVLDNREQLKVQRHLIKLMQLVCQYMEENNLLPTEN